MPSILKQERRTNKVRLSCFRYKYKKPFYAVSYICSNQTVLRGSPNGTRTRVVGVRGRYPRPLDDGTIFGWGKRIRTSINGARTRRPAVERSPSMKQI